MVANEFFLHRLLDGTDKVFVVPVYQRPYSWKRSNCEQLLKDLKQTYEKNREVHFFGSIVYVANNIAGVTEHIIIDGQQRITSVSLLLLAIKDYIDGNKDVNCGINTRKILKAYLTDEYANDAKKLRLVKGDDEVYGKLIERIPITEDSQIVSNYQYFGPWYQVP